MSLAEKTTFLLTLETQSKIKDLLEDKKFLDNSLLDLTIKIFIIDQRFKTGSDIWTKTRKKVKTKRMKKEKVKNKI